MKDKERRRGGIFHQTQSPDSFEANFDD